MKKSPTGEGWTDSAIHAQIRVLAALRASPPLAADKRPKPQRRTARPGKGAHRGVPEMDDPGRMARARTARRWPARGTDRSGASRPGGHQGAQTDVHERGGVRPVAAAA